MPYSQPKTAELIVKQLDEQSPVELGMIREFEGNHPEITNHLYQRKSKLNPFSRFETDIVTSDHDFENHMLLIRQVNGIPELVGLSSIYGSIKNVNGKSQKEIEYHNIATDDLKLRPKERKKFGQATEKNIKLAKEKGYTKLATEYQDENVLNIVTISQMASKKL